MTMDDPKKISITVDKTLMEMETALKRVIVENDKMRKALKAVKEWCSKGLNEGGDIPSFAEDIAPLVYDALSSDEE